MESTLRLLSWLGLAASLALVAFAVWIHLNLDPIIRILPVLLFGGAGLMIGLICLPGVLAGGPGGGLTAPAPQGFSDRAGLVLGLALVAAGIDGLASGTVRTPNVVFATSASAADAPGTYWGLVGVYLLGGLSMSVAGFAKLRRRARPHSWSEGREVR